LTLFCRHALDPLVPLPALKRFRAVATRYEKTGTNYLAIVHVACIMAWLN
jgi:transposase